MSLVPFVTESLGQLERQEFLISLHDCVPLTLALVSQCKLAPLTERRSLDLPHFGSHRTA